MLGDDFLKDAVRDITDDEVEFYEEHGWVKLDGLVSKEVIAKLLDASQDLLDDVWESLQAEGVKKNDGPNGIGRVSQTENWGGICIDHPGGAQTLQARSIKIDPFLSLKFDKRLGRAASRLINRSSLTDEPIATRYFEDTLLRRTSGRGDNSNGTVYHQDLLGMDRAGCVNIWIALDEVTPEQGAMRFLDRSHQAGSLGPVSTSEKDLLERYPKLPEKYGWTPPFHYQPGDATVHHQHLVHGAPENNSDKPRWSYVCVFMAGDCIVKSPTGVAEPLERFPQVYP